MALDSVVIHLSAFIVAYLSASHISRRKAGFPFGLLAFVVGSLVGCLTAIFVMAFLASTGQEMGLIKPSTAMVIRRGFGIMLYAPIAAGFGIWRGRKLLKEKLEKSRLNKMSQQLKASREKEEKLATQEQNRKVAQSAKPDQSVATLVSADATDDDLYAIAWKEIENNDQDKGLWARLYAEHSGNSELLRTAYLKLRVEELGKQREIEKNKPPPPGKFKDLSKARSGIESVRKNRGEAIIFDVEKEPLYVHSSTDPSKKWIFFGFKFRHHPLIWFFGIIFTVVIVANLIN